MGCGGAKPIEHSPGSAPPSYTHSTKEPSAPPSYAQSGGTAAILSPKVLGRWYLGSQFKAEVMNDHVKWASGNRNNLKSLSATVFTIVQKDGTEYTAMLENSGLRWSDGETWTREPTTQQSSGNGGMPDDFNNFFNSTFNNANVSGTTTTTTTKNGKTTSTTTGNMSPDQMNNLFQNVFSNNPNVHTTTFTTTNGKTTQSNGMNA